MGLFTEFNQNGSIYHLNDDNTKDVQTYSTNADATIAMHIIRLDAMEQSVEDNVVSTHETNLDGDQTAVVFKRDKVVWKNQTFLVVNEPEYLPLIQKTKVRLIRGELPAE